MNKTKVLIVDDSAVVRQVLSAIVQSDASLELLGAAPDPLFAMKRMQRQWPDVIVLDVEMPRMDGITFLNKIMAERPTPVIVCSTLTANGTETSMQALSAGALALIAKPRVGAKGYLTQEAGRLLEEIKSAASARLSPLRARARCGAVAPKFSADVMLPAAERAPLIEATDRLVALGTSTGGTQALEALLTALPAQCPGLVIVQHMPEQFTAAFAQRLNGLSRLQVKEASDGDRVLPGLALIAPGGRHLLVRRSGAQYCAEVKDGPLVSRHKPSVDVLFRSVARAAGRNAMGVIMTGMGDDGAAGLEEMLRAGAQTVAQDEASCIVFGMPREALRRGAAQRVLGLDDIAQAIVDFGAARQSEHTH